MEPEIVHQETLSLLGLQERFSHDKEDFEGIWRRFMEHHDQIQALSTDGAYYGANYVVEEGEQMDYLAGVAVTGVQDVPEGLTPRRIRVYRRDHIGPL